MERPERYDPEDLEHLMLERGFDELLEEERAYALRHLEGRAEYERMRSLLLHVREDIAAHERLDANPAIREHVLEAFRAQRKPHWEIWLNSVKAFLIPKRSSALWRPALAFTSMTAIVLTSILLWRASQEQHFTLAEVRQPMHKEAPETPMPLVEENDKSPSEAAKSPRISNDLREVEPLMPSATPELKEHEGALANSEQRSGSVSRVAAETLSRYSAADMRAATNEDKDVKTFAANAVAASGVTASDSTMEEVALTKVKPKHQERKWGKPPYDEDDLLGLLKAAW